MAMVADSETPMPTPKRLDAKRVALLKEIIWDGYILAFFLLDSFGGLPTITMIHVNPCGQDIDVK